MAQYIDKSALVAELNRLIAELVEEGEDTMFEQGRISAFEDIKVFINHTLEVKGVNLEKEIKNYLDNQPIITRSKGIDYKLIPSPEVIAKYFFELGIKATQKGEPKPYFYCKYGGTMPLCSDCKRNHNNSSFKTEEITTWYAPSNGTKHCINYIKQEQS